jgi:hypothetical protein
MALGAFSEEFQGDRIFSPKLVRQNPRAHKTLGRNSPTPKGRSAMLAFFYLAERGGRCVG